MNRSALLLPLLCFAATALAQEPPPAPPPAPNGEQPADEAAQEPPPEQIGKAQPPQPSQEPPPPPTRYTPPPVAEGAPPPEASAVPSAAPTGGKWVFSTDYGWIWAPQDESYTYYPASGYPYVYAYEPSGGWGWIAAPWVFGGYWPWHHRLYGGPFLGRYGWYHGSWGYFHPWGYSHGYRAFYGPHYRTQVVGFHNRYGYRGGVYHGGFHGAGGGHVEHVEHGGMHRGGGGGHHGGGGRR